MALYIKWKPFTDFLQIYSLSTWLQDLMFSSHFLGRGNLLFLTSTQASLSKMELCTTAMNSLSSLKLPAYSKMRQHTNSSWRLKIQWSKRELQYRTLIDKHGISMLLTSWEKDCISSLIKIWTSRENYWKQLLPFWLKVAALINTGMSMNDPNIKDLSKWGQNHLGKVEMDIREAFA